MKNKWVFSLLILFSIVAVTLSKLHYDQKIKEQGERAALALVESERIEKEKKISSLNQLYQELSTDDLLSVDIKTIKTGIFDKMNNGEEITIVFVGDSTTEQNFQTNGQPVHVGIIETTLKKIYGNDVRIVNSGISGNTIVDIAERIDESVINYRPDVVIINSGLNDVGRVTDENFEEQYRYIIERIKNETDAKIYLRSSNPTQTENTNKTMENNFIPIMEKLADEHDLGYLNLYQYYSKQVEAHEKGFEFYNNDNYHPNENGQKLIADLLLYTLIQNSSVAE